MWCPLMRFNFHISASVIQILYLCTQIAPRVLPATYVESELFKATGEAGLSTSASINSSIPASLYRTASWPLCLYPNKTITCPPGFKTSSTPSVPFDIQSLFTVCTKSLPVRDKIMPFQVWLWLHRLYPHLKALLPVVWLQLTSILDSINIL